MLLEHDRPFNFDEKCVNAFMELKRALVTVVIIAAPDWSMSFKLMYDASDHSVGAVLGQRKGKNFHSIYYANKTLKKC